MNLDTILLLSIPVIAALVGWLTNKLAVYMTFYPIQYVGFKPFGWQGIIPSKSHKMASKAVSLITSKLISLEEEFAKLDAAEISVELQPRLQILSRTIVTSIMENELPLVWKLLPHSQKEEIYRDTTDQLPKAIEKLMLDVKNNIHELLDINKMMVEGLTKNPQMLIDIFQTCGEKEFKFIEKSGFVFGFLFGLIQMFIWNQFHYWWLLPVGGLVVGYLTNFLALKLIFRPIEPVKIGPVTVQGLFMKRQNEVSEAYSKILADELLSAEKIFDFIIETKGLDLLSELSRKHIDELVDNSTGSTKKTFIKLAGGSQKYDRIKTLAAKMFAEVLPSSIKGMFEYADRTLQIGHTLENRLKSLSKRDFEDVLHPIFEEDEHILIIVGAVLGLVAGFIQLAFLT